MLLLRDTVPNRPTGHLVCHAYRNGRLVDVVDDANLVVNEAKPIQANCLSGAPGYVITQMGFGTNLTTPQPTDTSLTNAYYNAFASVTYPAAGQMQFNFVLGVNEANGMMVGEFGLVTTNGLLFARKVRLAAMEKQSDLQLLGSWLITF